MTVILMIVLDATLPILPCLFISAHRLKNQRKAVVTTVDKKVPNGILEEQGNVAFYFFFSFLFFLTYESATRQV